MFVGHPILEEIKQGFKLRPTKTIDKSKPIFLAEGEDDSMLAPMRRAPDGVPPAPVFVPPPPCTAAPPPPPPMVNGVPGAPPPPPPMIKRSSSPSLNKLGGATPAQVDRGALLKGIHGGVRLRKTVTADKSGLIIDDEMRQKSVKVIEPAGPSTLPPPPPLPSTPSPSATLERRPVSPRSTLTVPGDSSEDERYQTPDDRLNGSNYATPEPFEDSPPSRRRSVEPKKEVKKSDYVFEEKNLRVTSDDLKQEIPTGSAAAKIAKFMQGDCNGNSTLPRSTFRASPLRSSFLSEVNNNQKEETAKPKPVSKWAPVETGGLRQPTRGNVPLEKTERSGSESRFPSRQRSNSALAEPTVERARTQSPSAEKNYREPISIKTDFNATTTTKRVPPIQTKFVKPDIEETPPTPKATKMTTNAYTYKPRTESPVERELPSPVSSMSSASLPSPSSLSPGNTSPDTTPRRRINPGFDKAKEKFGGTASSTSPSLPAPRPYFLKNTLSTNTPVVTTNTVGTSPMPSPRPAAPGSDEIDALKKAVKEAAASKQTKNRNRVINVPISAPWHSPRDSSSEASKRMYRGLDPFASMSPDAMRRNYRFDINLNSDSPLSIVNR